MIIAQNFDGPLALVELSDKSLVIDLPLTTMFRELSKRYSGDALTAYRNMDDPTMGILNTTGWANLRFRDLPGGNWIYQHPFAFIT